MHDTKNLKAAIRDVGAAHKALTAAIKAFEACQIASPDDILPPAGALLIDTMGARSAELSTAFKRAESEIKALAKATESSIGDAASMPAGNS